VDPLSSDNDIFVNGGRPVGELIARSLHRTTDHTRSVTARSVVRILFLVCYRNWGRLTVVAGKKLDIIRRYSLSPLHERGIGLKSLRNRFEKLCKRLSLMTSPRGTELDIRLPLSGKLA
jgi:hypothetical protein